MMNRIFVAFILSLVLFSCGSKKNGEGAETVNVPPVEEKVLDISVVEESDQKSENRSDKPEECSVMPVTIKHNSYEERYNNSSVNARRENTSNPEKEKVERLKNNARANVVNLKEKSKYPEKEKSEMFVKSEKIEKTTVTDKNNSTTLKSGSKTKKRVARKKKEISSFNTRYYALKTNMLGWAIGSVNISAEIQISTNTSLILPFYYSPFDISEKYSFRNFMFTPGVRYWIGNVGQGHNLGINGLVGCYNLKWDKYRYQDNKPLWGVGLNYGYKLPISDRLGVDFNFGVGYIHSNYEKFYNIKNGMMFKSGEKSLLGITNLEISLVYKL